METHALFVYGTLKDREQMETIARQRDLPEPVVATLTGYAQHDSGYGFPVAMPKDGSNITGLVWSGLWEWAFRGLDQYEGAGTMYERVLVTVDTIDGPQDAWFYVGKEDYWAGTLQG